ncbi:Uncharacterised protein [Bordetella pertussis]|nr:Uncharacterised protein [Bordetella pertussis]
MRADDDRRAGRAGFDQVLPAQPGEAAPHDGNIGGRVVERHLAQGIAQQYVDMRSGLARAGRAPRIGQAGRLQLGGRLVETLGMARNQQDQRPRRGGAMRLQGADRLDEHGVLALARARQRNHGPARRPGPGVSDPQLRLGQRHVELQAAGHRVGIRTGLAQARAILVGLRQHPVQARQGLTQRLAQPAGLAQRRSGKARADQRHRHPLRARRRQQIGPDFPLHQQTAARRMARQEAPRRARKIVGQPGLLQLPASDRRAGPGPAAAPRASRPG